uniref:Uncharacterized protein n=1 Tax=Ficus carica TaxID=3494 RepID=A0AA88JBW7_FICCA|nr:hypothetical protein TIFTF001_040076 [Ficus carica]GMN68449.1 hypothetical protein TIFTF001_037507 [Ficus carica]
MPENRGCEAEVHGAQLGGSGGAETVWCRGHHPRRPSSARKNCCRQFTKDR